MIYMINKVYYNVTVKQKNMDLNIYYILTAVFLWIEILVQTSEISVKL